jgi:hypothetical protein
MLMFDEADPAAGVANVQGILQSFADGSPDGVKKTESDREAKFAFKIGGGGCENLNTLLDESVAAISPEIVEQILRRMTAEKFSEFDISDDGASIWATSHVVWRGGIRPGEIIWQAGGVVPVVGDESGNWKVHVRYNSEPGSANASLRWPQCEWVLGDLSADDIKTISRYHVLQTDSDLRENSREAAATAMHAHSIAVGKIWQRLFLDDSRVVTASKEYRFTDDARASNDLAQLFKPMIEEELEQQFPSHPEFTEVLGGREVSLLTEQLFSGSGSDGAEVQKLAASFALPLGLVYEHEGVLIPQPPEVLGEVPAVKQIVELADLNKGDVVPISDLSRRMQAAPFGLTREAQHLILVALVSQRVFEFVTSSENRINHRSLDLQIIWEDIVGLAAPSAEGYSDEQLLNWAVILTGDRSLKTLRISDARLKVYEVLSQWLVEWQRKRVVERFDALPDENLTSKIWRTAASVKKTFSVVAESIDALIQDKVELFACLLMFADVFANSEEEYAA